MADMVVAWRSLADAYQDSVKLMREASDITDSFDVMEAFAIMATDENKSMVVETGILEAADLEGLDPNDLLLVVEADDEDVATSAIEGLVDGIRGSASTGVEGESGGAPPPQSLSNAIHRLPGANLALVSVPGEYAAREAWKALHRGLNVQVFSDNVDLAEERALKDAARDTDRLVMGPDCGTAIINGVPLGFANAVDRGAVGVVAASGTGLQEVTALVDRAGAGVSQAIGTGGRDLSASIGGLSMQQGIERLTIDPRTDVIVLISKPPAEETLDPLLKTIGSVDKPVVVDFIGADRRVLESTGATPAGTLAEAARLAVESIQSGSDPVEFDDGVEGFTDPEDVQAIAEVVGDPSPERLTIRGLFAGGTFAQEALSVLREYVDPIGSNLPAGADLEDPLAPIGHSVVDLGADTFTRGRPHPMIDPALRTEQLEQALADDTVRLVLLDVVLGYGAHDDPAGSIAEAVGAVRNDAWPQVVASVCGTRGDPQQWPGQVEQLIDAGVHVTESNAAAARLAGELWTATGKPGGTER